MTLFNLSNSVQPTLAIRQLVNESYPCRAYISLIYPALDVEDVPVQNIELILREMVDCLQECLRNLGLGKGYKAKLCVITSETEIITSKEV